VKQCAWTNEAAERICFFVVLTFTYILPLVLVIFCYIQIYRTAKRARRTTPAGYRTNHPLFSFVKEHLHCLC